MKKLPDLQTKAFQFTMFGGMAVFQDSNQTRENNFFSSRRRHTSFSRDWSSDVCSSDLNNVTVGLSGDWRDGVGGGGINAFTLNWVQGHLRGDTAEGGSFGKLQFSLLRLQHLNRTFRSEERRVGEEGRPREGDAGGQSGR